MKKIYSVIAGFLLVASVWAQAPQKMSYQAVIRNSSNALITSTPVGMKISILQGSSSGAAVYVERQTPSTNANGLVSLEIGSGTIVTGTFAGINWATGPYFIKTETDPTGGTVYTIAGTNELMSVPYALFSANGTPGPIGLTGAAGTNGTNGLAGSTGAQGIQGLTGLAGATGTNGTNGLVGATGAAGTNGTNGLVGATGATGAVGVTGAAGTNGTNGLVGATGATGAVGATGATGSQGPIGLTGATGAVGATGATGSQGSIGLTGATGAVGATGATGANGQGGVTTAGTGINVTGAGTVGSPYVVSRTSPCSLTIGQAFQGGIIFYLDPSGCHGLISASADQSTGIQWYNGSYTNTTAFASCVGCGDGNTSMIVFNQGTGSYAAKLCFDLSLGGYSDWYLPSKYELNVMFNNIGQYNPLGLGNVGGFAYNYYWSSTEFGTNYAWYQNLSNGSQNVNFKNDVAYYVRAVRAF